MLSPDQIDALAALEAAHAADRTKLQARHSNEREELLVRQQAEREQLGALVVGAGSSPGITKRPTAARPGQRGAGG